MEKREKTSKIEIESLLLCIQNIELKLGEASGPTVAAELRMRLIGQFHQSVKDKVKELAKKRKNNRDEYWDCDLYFLEQAIADTFKNILSPEDSQALLEFRDLRNSLMHANFVDLMIFLKIKPTGRDISRVSDNDNRLNSDNIKEAIKSIDRNQGLPTVCKKAKIVIEILDKILRKVFLFALN